MMERIEFQLDGKTVTLETQRLAKQSNGAVLVQCGGTAVLVTVNSTKPRPGIDFFPLTVDYVEKMYAAGKIPGGFFRREGALGEKEILTSRFIDRALRPLFPEAYQDDTQVMATVLAADDEVDSDTLAFVGASAAVMVSDIPFPGPIGACRVGRVDGQLVANPTFEERERADLEIIIASSDTALVMVEGGAEQVPESDVLRALRFGFEINQAAIAAQKELVARAGRPKRELSAPSPDQELRQKIESLALERVRAAARIADKKERYRTFDEIEREVVEGLLEEYRTAPLTVSTLEDLEKVQSGARELGQKARSILGEVRSSVMCARILDEGVRIDGRSTTDIRPISCEVEVFDQVHGSSVFTRGETQALVVVTLAGSRDEQVIDGLRPRHSKRFMLHYNFPAYSVGEVRPLRGPNRRERGHGALAQRAIERVLPEPEDCPYTIRVVSEVMESNGSSSMATVCGSTLALMQAGIAIREAVAGIAMGLIQGENGRHAILSDILGDEDHLGDMDFKVTGTRQGVTAVQMDIKISGLDWEVMEKALEQARDGRLHILDRMAEETAESLPGFKARSEVSASAPRMTKIFIKPDRIRDLIGPGGKVIRAIQDATGAKIDIDDSGEVKIFTSDVGALEKTQAMVEEITQEAELDRIYVGKVKRVTDFGAFVEIFPGTDGLLHISEMADHRVAKVEDICVEGDEVLVKCIDIDPSGRIRLSRRAALADQAGTTDAR
ncbi:MAG: polyribonucleotide nucleotidyltransferase [Myxococcota bacterium]